MSKTIVVTGGTGFLGLHLVKKLIMSDKNIHVCILDNFITSSKKNLDKLSEHFPNQIDFFQVDITKPNELEFLTDLYPHIDEIYHMASIASPPLYSQFPLETLEVGYTGTKNLLDIIIKHYPECKFLFASSSEVYGQPLVHPQSESYYGNVNSYGTRSCFSADTEILTKNGYKLFSELKENDYIATLNEKTDTLEYHIPDEIIKEEYTGNMYHYKNYNIDLEVTPNHKMYVQKRDYDNFELLSANTKIAWDRAVLKKKCQYDGQEQMWFYFPESTKNLAYQKVPFIEKINMDLWLEFLGYYLSEGHTRIATQIKKLNNKLYKTGIFKIQISQSEEKNPEKFNKIKECLDKMPFNYNISKAGNSYFVISNKQLAIYLAQFGKSKDKFVPKELMNLSKRQLTILLDALVLGDGCVSNYKNKYRTTYSSKSFQLISDVQEILIKTGTFGNILQDSRGIYHIRFFSSPDKKYTYPNPNIKQYSGYVYCVNVKNHIILVRRNGKALFCGNCYDESKRVGETLCWIYNKKYNANTRIVRIFNTYGPGMNLEDGRIITEIMRAYLQSVPLNIFGDGNQTRCFNWVEDTIDSILTVTRSDYSSPVNVGSESEISINKLIQIFQKVTGSLLDVQYSLIDKDDPLKRKPDLTILKKLNPAFKTTPLEYGLQETLMYFLT